MPKSSREDVRIAHIGIAVRSIADALPFYRDVLGMKTADLAPMDGARISGLDAGGPLVELLEAVDVDSPIGKFVERRGPAIHHICFEVGNLEAALDRCRAAGIALIDDEPRMGAEGKLIAFLHPASTGGVLIELTGV
ncbi:MAG: methylmalonyl-CoA epimerase [Gemmatimonadota bacterium]|nr:methylmalonyl-CoA epimerase [Gemmatimonadota bacterium]